ncbi:hypothetical protein [Pseudoflavonifractor phocaeensis]|uniref:hypothetical protein n=1 Tax=Pseudoflavonifractor phocaeensis TaxID=1870988 RepID=UPI00195EB2FB|nr:hypothetical protein [Pseudoflavonifractor phocaeensis]MBM6926051.1 hypothetical protein [Pseudoflavonifractor phocaeensis]
MDLFALVAAFGGGIIGAYMGALPAFIMTGIFALVGSVLTAAGVGGDIAVGMLAFGSFVGPHIAFGGGVAAAGYAGKKGKLGSGTDILSSLNGLGEPDVILVGGIFGVLGYLISYSIGMLPVIGNAGPATTDLPGITVFILAIVTRLLFGETGITGKYTGTGKREWFSTGKGFVYNVVLGGGIGIVVSCLAVVLYQSGNTAAFGIFPIICFGFAAISLIFTQTGFATPATHHIFLPSALAASAGILAWGETGFVLGVVFGILGSLLGDLVGKTLNSHCDTHIDPPATTIFILTIIINAIARVI